MRKQGQNQKQNRALGLLLLLALLPARQSFAIGDSLECQVKEDDLKHSFARESEHYCSSKDPDDRACWQLLEFMKNLSAQLRAAKEKNCQKVVESAQRAQQVSGQLDAIERNLGTYNSLLAQYNQFDTMLKESIKHVEGKIKPVLAPHPKAPVPEPSDITKQKQQIEAALKDGKQWDKWTVKGTAEVKDAGNSKNHFAARHGGEFVKMLRKAEKENALDRQKIQSDITQLERNKEAMNRPPGQQQQPPPGNTTTKKGGGLIDGMNMNTLMGLATAGMGLAQMMKQQQAAQDQGMPQATSPTPASQNAAAEKPTPTVSKLEDGKNKGTPKVDAAPATNTDTSTAAGPANVPSGGPFREESDISAPEKAHPMAPATSKAPGGGGGGPGGSGGESPAQRELSAAALEQKKEEEAFQGIPGGGLGGGPGGGGSSMPPSAPSDPAVAAAEDGMKDLLNEMKDTVEGNGDGDGSSQAAEGGIMEMDAEDLFPRVRAAHVRSLKQGRVLNGLGEKITPDSE